MRIVPLERTQLAAATRVLADACAWDRADVVAYEKLFGCAGDAPDPQPFAALDDDGELVGVAATCERWLRVLAVVPHARGRGVGSALLARCEQAGARRTLDQPGNYLAPGIDVRNVETIAWLERRGWKKMGEPRTNVLIQVRDNPRVTAERAAASADAARARGYEIRRARRDELALVDAVRRDFGGAWPWEVARALQCPPSVISPSVPDPRPDVVAGVHVAIKDGAYCAFAAHDGNNQGLGWFGPTGTWPAHRGQGLGEALLLACLVDVAEHHERCEVAWIGPRPFYEKVAGIVEDRHFIVLAKP